MKTTAFLLLIAFIQVSAATTYSQSTKLNLNYENVKLSELLDKIEKSSDYRFFYDSRAVDLSKTVSVNFQDSNLKEVLDKILGSDLIYEMVNNNIVVIKNAKAGTGGVSVSQQQAVKVSGKVTDSSGQPLPGVSVVIKGTTKGTITDNNGNYSFPNVPGNTTLVFSFVGMKAQEITVSGKTTINVVMEEDTIGIEEVVAVGYGTVKKVNLTGAVSNVTAEVLEDRPITDVGKGLQGTMPGLFANTGSGSPGTGTELNVRGFTSINGGGPLILVDNVPMDYNTINPNDIESVSVLKDAASAAIYGARAAYGVVLITTKKGMKGKPKISLSMNSAINSPTATFGAMDALELITYQNIGALRQGSTPRYDQYVVDAVTAHYNDPSQPVGFDHPTKAGNEWEYSANTDWRKELLRDNYPMRQINASVSGGGDNFNYYTSFGYLYQEGITKPFDEKYNRYNMKSRLNYNVTKWLKLGSDITITTSDKIFPGDEHAGNFPENETPLFYTYSPLMPVYDPNGNYAMVLPYVNPVQFLRDGGYRKRETNNMWISGNVRLTPVKRLVIDADYSLHFNQLDMIDLVKVLPRYNMLGYVGPVGRTSPGILNKKRNTDKDHILNIYATYENIFNQKHFVKVLAGFSQEDFFGSNISVERRETEFDAIPYLTIYTGEDYVGDTAAEYSDRGAFARLNYNFAERYFLEFNGRYDGSSKFPKASRFAFFPSVSGGWRIDNEPFFANLKRTVDVLKIRASYGSLGNQNVASNYPYIANLSFGNVGYIMGGVLPRTVGAPGLAGEHLTWETVKQSNFGFDFAILNNRLSGSFDLYKRMTEGMLTKSATLPAVLAVNEPNVNAADLKTTGFDLSLSWRNTFQNGNYGLTFTLSDNTSEITKFSNPTGNIGEYYVGKKIGEIWGLTTGGMFQSDEEAAGYLDQTQINGRPRQAGDLWFVDLDGDQKITRGVSTLDDHGDLSVIGNSRPRYNFGLSANVKWKGLDFRALLQGTAKRTIYPTSIWLYAQYANPIIMPPKIGTDYWTEENRDAYFPAPLLSGGSDVTATQTHFLQNAAYVRLKQLTVGYTVPKFLTQKAGVERLRVYFSGENLWEATKMIEIIDPEKISPRIYPLYRTYAIGVNIDF